MGTPRVGRMAPWEVGGSSQDLGVHGRRELGAARQVVQVVEHLPPSRERRVSPQVSQVRWLTAPSFCTRQEVPPAQHVEGWCTVIMYNRSVVCVRWCGSTACC